MCLVGPENSIFRKLKSVDPKKRPLTTEINLHFYFHFKGFSEKERERERERAREEKTSPRRYPVRAPVRERIRPVRRRRSTLREIAPSIAISPSRDRAGEIAISDRDRVFWICVFWVVACVWICVFLSSFPNTRKYFPENFLKCNQTHRNIFLFQKLAFPKNMYFPENVLRQPNTALM